MALIDVTAKKGDNACAVQFDFGDNVEDMINKWGGDVTFTNAQANMKIVLQAGLRRCLEKGTDPVAYATAFKPGVQSVGAAVDPVIAMKAKFATMSVEEKTAFLKELKAS